jgi:hypothetical protein
MRRGRIITGFTICVTAALIGAPGALADYGTIAQDLADGSLDGKYTQAELREYLQSATVEGYGNPVETPVQGPTTTPAGPGATVTPPASAATPPETGVAGVQSPVTAGPAAPTTGVAGVQTPSSAAASPLAQTRQVGTLPFTGMDLVLLTGGGMLLLLLGLGARRLGRHQV